MGDIKTKDEKLNGTAAPTKNNIPIIGITAGDPNGIGYEVIIKALAHPELQDMCQPVVYGSQKAIRHYIDTLGEEYKGVRIRVTECGAEAPIEPGKATAEAGKAAFAALEQAVRDLKEKNLNALVTAPINKDTIQSDAFHFAGHTEYLTAQFPPANGRDSLMMMVSDTMRVALVCNHTPIAEISKTITEERIVSKMQILHDTLRSDFRIRRPRIAVLALNPHAGDNGLIGTEEQTIIRPAIDKAREAGIDAFGPYSADGFFGAGQYRHFDAVLAMYHDQGLIPFKTLDMSGVNYTAGLPIVRTSPDHGTAYDKAGRNAASEESMLHAIYAAIDALRIRREWEEVNRNPLKIEVRERPERPERPPFKPFIPKDNQDNDK